MVAVLAVGGGVYYIGSKKTNNGGEQNQEGGVAATTTNIELSDSKPIVEWKVKIQKEEQMDDYSETLYSLGILKNTKYSDGELMLVYGGSSYKGQGSTDFIRFIKRNNEIIVLNKISSISESTKDFMKGRLNRLFPSLNIREDNEFKIAELSFPQEVVLGNFKLEYPREGITDGSRPSGLISVSKDSNNGVEIFFAKNNYAFNILRPDGSSISYYSTLLTSTSSPTLKNSFNELQDYFCNVERGGVYAEIISSACVGGIADSDLVRLKTLPMPNGNLEVFVLKNKNHKMLTDIYKEYLETSVDSGTVFYDDQKKSTNFDREAKIIKLSYEDFIKKNPLIFFKDQFGNWVKFTRKTFVPLILAEPMIYLYPEKTTDIFVKINNDVAFSEPEYMNGWTVSANKAGEITDLRSGKKYEKLFWEGLSRLNDAPNNGIVITKDSVEEFLRKSLVKYGLNQKEINDFVEAWMPKLNEEPYYLIGFYDTVQTNKLAPIEISPIPDTLIRVTMYFKALEDAVVSEGFEFPKEIPQRKGFTVVEWGGLIK